MDYPIIISANAKTKGLFLVQLPLITCTPSDTQVRQRSVSNRTNYLLIFAMIAGLTAYFVRETTLNNGRNIDIFWTDRVLKTLANSRRVKLLLSLVLQVRLAPSHASWVSL